MLITPYSPYTPCTPYTTPIINRRAIGIGSRIGNIAGAVSITYTAYIGITYTSYIGIACTAYIGGNTRPAGLLGPATGISGDGERE